MKRLLAIAICSLSSVASVLHVQAVGTSSGTLISNLATVTYTLDGVDQDPITSSATFLVDNMVNLTVAETSGTLTTDNVFGGATGVVSTFTVTNNGNTLQDYLLSVGQGENGQSLFGKIDNFDTTDCSVLIESEANQGFQALQDTATFIDELVPDTSQTVYMLCNIPAAQIDGDVSIVSLLATTHKGGAPGIGQLTTQDSGADASDAVQVVFIDASAEDAQADNSTRNGQHSARDGYWLETLEACDNSSTQSATLVLTPGNEVDSGPENKTPEVLAAISGWVGTDTEVYKDDQGGSESGSAQSRYSTTYNSELSGADIVWDGAPDPYIRGSTYLLVKDGKHEPAWYLFDISNWDGREAISLSGFWPDQGSISHVSIYNGEACNDLSQRSITFDWPDQDNNAATFVEAAANDGSIPFASTLTLANGTFTGTNGTALTGSVVSNVPSGLTAVLTKTDGTTATLSLIGNATAHANANDIVNLTVSLNDSTFALGNAAAVTSALKNDLVIDFIDSVVIALTQTVIHIQHPAGCSDVHKPKDKDEDKDKDKDKDKGEGSDHGCELVPGSILTYQIEMPVTDDIEGLVLTNPIPINMSYVPDSIFVNGVAKTDATDGDNAEFSANTVLVTAGIIAAASTFSFTFRTIVN
jgi:hypothetical protein